MTTPADLAAAASQSAAMAKSAAEAAIADADSARKAREAAAADAVALAKATATIVTPAVSDAIATSVAAAIAAAIAPTSGAPRMQSSPPKARAGNDLGEKIVVGLDPQDRAFLTSIAHPELDKVTSLEQLKHFADVWWNLCQWEKQRADAINSKAQMLLGLSGVATALLGTSGLPPTLEGLFRAFAIALFLFTVLLSVWASRIRQHAGFAEQDVFEALSCHETPVPNTPAFQDGKPFECYLRETCIQRWFIYRKFKKASASKTGQIQLAQYSACAAIAATAVSVLLPLRDPLGAKLVPLLASIARFVSCG